MDDAEIAAIADAEHRKISRQIQTQHMEVAQRLPSGTAVIWLDGITGCYQLDRVKAVEGLA